MIETEIEIEVPDLDAARKIIEEKCTLKKKMDGVVIYFDKDRLLKGEQIRLGIGRISKPEELHFSKFYFKGKPIEGIKIQEREELSTIIKNPREFKEILIKIFGKPVLEEEFINDKYTFDNLTVAVKKLGELVGYIEIEGPKEKLIETWKVLGIGGNLIREGGLNVALKRAGIVN